jgi:4'-phosphopantetheinyl transferase
VNHPIWVTAVEADLPLGSAWLGPREQEVLATLQLPHRRRDWMLGRWAAKRAMRAAADGLAGFHDSELEILAAADGAPEAWITGRRAPVTISLSHRHGLGVCLLAGHGVAAGCDAELVEPRAPVFAADWFTDGEQRRVAEAPPEHRDLMITLIWSAKESVLKAMRHGLRRDPRDVEVSLKVSDRQDVSGGWRPLAAVASGAPCARPASGAPGACPASGCQFTGWWRLEDRLVMTAVMDPAYGPPALVKEMATSRRV